ncbi:hypothetical protein DY000_02022332 [Brassica cretica]|uniref:Protein TSSC4 n=1 Tax=Brassica cretica TaxID=69181 RepID=A0ABQ7E3I4_BRACR|nr:hypothetical protein DY000_02022332 [Brassica cretica]
MLRDEEEDEQYGSGEPSRIEEADTRDPASQSIDITTSPSIDTSTSTSIDPISCCRSTPLEIHDRSSCFWDSADSTQKSTDVSSFDIVSYVDKEITMEDFLELEDEAQPENLDQNLEKKLDDDQLTSGRDLGTSLKLEPVEEKEYKSEASHLAVTKHLRSPVCAEVAAGFHKRVKRIHDPMKFVVPCAVFEADFPDPPDKSMHLGSYNGVFDDHMYAVASQRGLRFRGDFDKGPTEAVSNDINKPASIDTTSSSSIDIHRVSEHIEFKVYQNLCDGGTATRSDKSGGKMRRIGRREKGLRAVLSYQ